MKAQKAKDEAKAGGDKEQEKEQEDHKKAKPQAAERMKEKAGPKKIVRMGEVDIDGSLPLSRALRRIRGCGFMYANAIAKISGIGSKPVSEMTDAERAMVEEMISNPDKHGIPSWMYNRRFDPEEGRDMHFAASKLELRKKMDINELKKRRCYRGVRHMLGLPVRGQRTRGSFRTQGTVGVSRVKAKPGAAPAPKK